MSLCLTVFLIPYVCYARLSSQIGTDCKKVNILLHQNEVFKTIRLYSIVPKYLVFILKTKLLV